MESHNASSIDIARLSFDRHSSEAILGAENDNVVHKIIPKVDQGELPSDHDQQPSNSSDADENASPRSHTVQMWNPVWLGKITLISFTILFAIMFVAVILLYHLPELHHGLSTQIPRNHYSWTYGPTAILCTNSRVFQRDRLKFNSSGHCDCSLEPGRSRMQTSHAMARDATRTRSRK